MSLTSALSIALTGLQASSAELQLSANNIANAQTPGYSEKTAELSPLSLGGIDGGVSISTYQRNTNAILTQSFNAATTTAGYLGTQNSYMSQIQSILNSNSSNPALSDAIAQFASAWTQLQSSPEDPTQQQQVIQAGETLAQQIGDAGAQIAQLQTQVSSDIQATVTQLNGDLTTVASLNGQIATAIANNQPTGDLEDARDQAINSVASITNVTVLPRSNGQVALYTSSGTPLLDVTAGSFTYNGTDILNSFGQPVTNDLSGGSLQAEVQFNATTNPPSSANGVNTIQKLNAQLTALVSAFTTNSSGPPQSFANAFNPNNTTGQSFFTADSNNSPGSFAVNPDLIDGSYTIPTGSSPNIIANTAASFSSNFDFNSTSAGLSNLSSATYAGLGTSILSGFQAAANTISSQSTTATQQQQYYQQSLSNATGVNVDTELVNLTNFQNSYAASAHVISTISQMYNDLLSTIG
jgi:flagellar hook-associated protein 1 FlgK